MSQQNMDSYIKILRMYTIEPDYIEDHGKVKKVYSKKGAFALKKITLTDEQYKSFIYTVQNLHQKGYQYVAPIYSTIHGEYLFQEEGNYYYLMPWIESNRLEHGGRQAELMKQAARLHVITATKTNVDQDYLKHFYENAKYNLEKRRLDYERYIDQCEKKLYMSPFELLFCTYFNQFMKMEENALRQLEDWNILASEKKHDRVVICHGNLADSHLLYDENGHSYLTSFERSFIASPVYDLLYYFQKKFYIMPQSASIATEWYMGYNRHNHLTEDERLLLFYYLTETSNIHRNILLYANDRSNPEKAFVAKLQRNIWQSQAANTVVNKMNEEINQAKLAELEETNEF